MSKKIQSVRGMISYLPQDVKILRKIENILINILQKYGYEEIIFPIIEKTKLFNKSFNTHYNSLYTEMYNFQDKKNRAISLRPEGTIGCLKTLIQNNIFYNHKFHKLWYKGSMFRYSKPQMGRYREFNQIGVEVYGYKNIIIEFEIIMLTYRFWKSLNILDHITLEINSIGSKKDRQIYQKYLSKFFIQNIKYINKKFYQKIKYNPISLLDNKNKKIKKIIKYAPKIYNFISHKNKKKFHKFCNFLNEVNIKYIINYNLVRGLDYYNNLVFEWTTNSIGSKKTICGGGRYNGLLKKFSKQKISAIGFAIGLDRILLLKKMQNNKVYNRKNVDIYLISDNEKSYIKITQISEYLKDIFANLCIMIDNTGKKIKRQLNYANQLNAKIVLIVTKQELKNKKIIIRNFFLRSEKIIFQDKIIKYIKKNYKKIFKTWQSPTLT